MRKSAPTFSTAVALVAMFMLFAQTFATAWAAGASPYGPQLDAFGNPLCVTSSVSDAGAPAGDHTDMSGCCTLGCGTVATALPAPSGDHVAAAAPIVRETPVFSVSVDLSFPRTTHDPGNPRAPPASA